MSRQALFPWSNVYSPGLTGFNTPKHWLIRFKTTLLYKYLQATKVSERLYSDGAKRNYRRRVSTLSSSVSLYLSAYLYLYRFNDGGAYIQVSNFLAKPEISPSGTASTFPYNPGHCAEPLELSRRCRPSAYDVINTVLIIIYDPQYESMRRATSGQWSVWSSP